MICIGRYDIDLAIWIYDTYGMQCYMARILNSDMEITSILLSVICMSRYSTGLAMRTNGIKFDALIMCPNDYLNDILI
jgi:hypothetical protein